MTTSTTPGVVEVIEMVGMTGIVTVMARMLVKGLMGSWIAFDTVSMVNHRPKARVIRVAGL